VKIIPRKRVHVRTENEICVPLPDFELVFLSRTDGPTHDLEEVGRSAVVDILNPHGDGENAARSELPCGLRGNRGDQAAVRKPTSADFDRFKKTGKSAAGADSINQMAVSEDHWLAIAEIGGNDGHGDAQVFKTARFEHAVDEISQAVIAGETQAGNSPSGDIAEAKRAARCNDTCERSSAGIGRAKNAAHAGAGDGRNRNVILLQDLQDAKMGETPGESPTQSEA
jgi:hypothetical protein